MPKTIFANPSPSKEYVILESVSSPLYPKGMRIACVRGGEGDYVGSYHINNEVQNF